MGPGRPKQHRHHWECRLTEWKHSSNDIPGSGWGYNTRRYWVCIRGGKIKHTERIKHPERSSLGGVLYENVHVAGSGIPYIEWGFDGQNSS